MSRQYLPNTADTERVSGLSASPGVTAGPAGPTTPNVAPGGPASTATGSPESPAALSNAAATPTPALRGLPDLELRKAQYERDLLAHQLKASAMEKEGLRRQVGHGTAAPCKPCWPREHLCGAALLLSRRASSRGLQGRAERALGWLTAGGVLTDPWVDPWAKLHKRGLGGCATG